MRTKTTCLTEEQLKIRAWGENHNEKVRKLNEKNLPTAEELINNCWICGEELKEVYYLDDLETCESCLHEKEI